MPLNTLCRALVLFASLMLTGLAAHAETGSVDDTASIASKTLGQAVKYTVYLPPDYSHSTRSYPVLYMMHGGDDGRYNDWFVQDNLGALLDRLITEGAIPAMIVITPDGLRNPENKYATYFMNDADGKFQWETMFIHEFIPAMQKRYRILDDKRFRAMGGLSMGGFASLMYAFKYPDLFSAAAVMSAAVRTDEQITQMDAAGYERRYGHAWGEGLSGEQRLNAQYHQKNVLDVLKHTPVDDLRKTRYYLDVGTNDPFFLGNALLHLEMNKLGIAHRFQTRPGAHNYDFWVPGSEPLLRFVGLNFQERNVQ
ncbi:alpha/beta hydrolase [Pseudomonas sp. B22129]|uniref:alpha/beta hydrolase n=1 Tax=Pseudomonas sp. B22129 TaxID=3235111 RepID=UPI003784AEEB